MSALNRLHSLWKQKINRRLYRRLPATGQVFIYDLEAQKGVRGELLSWSLGGISLVAPLTAPVGRQVKVCFEAPPWFEKAITLSAQILRIEATEGRDHFMVVTFNRWEEPDHARLKEALLSPHREFEYPQSPSPDDRRVSEP